MGQILRGPVCFMRSHKGFLGAADIATWCPLKIKIVDIKTYEAGERPMGHVLKEVMSTMIYDVRNWKRVGEGKTAKRLYSEGDTYRRGKKEWPLNSGVQAVLRFRYGFWTTDWADQEIELFVEPCRSVTGGRTWGIRICPSDLDQGMTEEQITAHMRRHLAYVPPPPAQAFEDIEETPLSRDTETGWAE